MHRLTRRVLAGITLLLVCLLSGLISPAAQAAPEKPTVTAAAVTAASQDGSDQALLYLPEYPDEYEWVCRSDKYSSYRRYDAPKGQDSLFGYDVAVRKVKDKAHPYRVCVTGLPYYNDLTINVKIDGSGTKTDRNNTCRPVEWGPLTCAAWATKTTKHGHFRVKVNVRDAKGKVVQSTGWKKFNLPG